MLNENEPVVVKDFARELEGIKCAVDFAALHGRELEVGAVVPVYSIGPNDILCVSRQDICVEVINIKKVPYGGCNLIESQNGFSIPVKKYKIQ